MGNAFAAARALRARLGAKWSVVGLLVPIAAFGVLHFGPRAGLVIALCVASCAGLGIATRALAGEPWRALNPGSLITGLLLGLTLSPDIPLFAILLGATVAEVAGKQRFAKLGQNPFNPAALGRAAIAVVELVDPPPVLVEPDVVTAASPLYVAAGGSAPPELWDMLIGLTPGAIGETSAGLLALTGGALLVLVVVKREAALAMIGTVIVLVLVLPATPEIHGHAPWALDPVVYLLGGPTFLYAFFFATDPATTPNTRRGGLIFGAGAGALGVLGRLYTTIPGAEMWAILIMNLATPVLDRALRGSRSRLPGAAAEEGARSFYRRRGPTVDGGVRDLVFEVSGAIETPDPPFEILDHVIASGRAEIVERIRASGLRGCGGAQFLAASKWDAVLGQPGPRILVVNAQEGEPDSFKDRMLMERCPDVVLAGVAIAAHVIEAAEVHFVFAPDDAGARAAIEKSLVDLGREHPLLAERFRLVDGPGLYVCGEESALLAYLEGERGEPRERPPHPTERGLRGAPTLIHNVETLAWLPCLLAGDAALVSDLPRFVSVSGAVRCPGVYAVPRDASVEELLARAGGTPDGVPPLAYAVGGPTGELLPAEDASGVTVGDLPGTGAVRVIEGSGCVVAETLRAARFAAAETCGLCTPCRVGTVELERLVGAVARGEACGETLEWIEDLGETMADTSACGLGRDAPRRALSVLRRFPRSLTDHLDDEECDACRRST